MLLYYVIEYKSMWIPSGETIEKQVSCIVEGIKDFWFDEDEIIFKVDRCGEERKLVFNLYDSAIVSMMLLDDEYHALGRLI